ncbi:hypothetical protein HDU92_002669 [Lobulomyces angularis]|nr:hypothetical protein HDU92_002669 [Lobulomyces angularis]
MVGLVDNVGSSNLKSVKLWQPKFPEQTQMNNFRLFVNKSLNLNLKDYFELYHFSISRIPEFWRLVWEFTNITSSKFSDVILDSSKKMNQIPKWFPESKLNFAENFFQRRDDKIALITNNEFTVLSKITYAELFDKVHRLSLAFRRYGIKPGDRIVGYIPLIAESIVAMLAATAIGAVWSSCSPDFGVKGVLERFEQIKPKILITVDRVYYNQKWFSHLKKLEGVANGLSSSLEKIIVIEYFGKYGMEFKNCLKVDKTVSWDSLINYPPTEEMVFEQLPFDHPVFILYSSGTTGKPKCIVHGAGGILLQHKKELMLHVNLKPEDVFFYFTTVGWMMFNWMCSALTIGSTVILYDGSPFSPSPHKLFELIEQFKINVFGVSAKYIQSLQQVKFQPKNKLESLHTILSTGSPLTPESFDFIYRNIKSDVLVGSITGGTDICSLFAGSNPVLPVYRGEIQSPCLGMAIEGWSEEGKVLLNEPGDLVCTKPFPCMPVFFWDDEGNKKYNNAYFNKFDGVWYHGDYIFIIPGTGGVIMLGRSDGILNPGGVRFGSAEIYNVLESFVEIEDSLCVAQKLKQVDDERVVLFLKLKKGYVLNDKLLKKIKTEIRELLSPRHIPAVILQTSEIPYTLTGKKGFLNLMFL